MKQQHTFRFPTLSFVILLTALTAFNTVFAQQNIGAHPNIDAGFESQAAGNLPSQSSAAPNTSATYWAYSISGNSQVRTIVTTGGYGGPKYLSVGKNNATQNSSTTVVSNVVTTNTFSANTKYIAQFHYKINAGLIDTAGSSIFISGDNNQTTRSYSSLYGLTTNTTWTKYTRVITTGATQTTLGEVGIVAKSVLSASSTYYGIMDVDNVVVYPADDQNNPVADETAPSAVTGLSATGNPAIVSLTWNAPSGGVDGGGYMVVRFTGDPVTEPNPLQNAVYKASSTNTIGSTGTVVYVGTDNFFDDGGVTIGTNYWYKVYAVDKAFNYSSAALTTSPVAATAKVNFYYDGTGSTDLLTNWWSNSNGTGTHPASFTLPGQVYHILSNADLVSTLSISGIGSGIILGSNAGVNAFTVDFNSGTLPQIDTIYQSLDGNPMVLNYNNPNVPSINQLFDQFTQIHYRASGVPISVGTTKVYDGIYVENGADVTFNGGSSTVAPPKTRVFFVAAGSTATVGTLSSRWLQIIATGSATVNGKLVTPKLTGMESVISGTAAATGGAIQFEDPGSVVTLGPSSTVEYSGISSTTTQIITPRADYANLVISGPGVSKTINAPIGISGNLTMNTSGATGLLLTDGLTGTGALNINGTLTLTSGKINTDATNVLVLGNNATVSGGNNSSYVNGPVKRNTAGTGNYTLPTGKGNKYRPVTIKPAASTASVYQAEFFNAPYSILTVSAPLTNVDTTYWDVTKISGANASVGLTLDGATAIPNATGADELVVAHFVSGTWNNVSATPINPGTAITGTATSTVQTTFSPFTLGLKPTSVVPVTLVSFKGNLQNGKANLFWSATEERNLISYTVEESNDGISFSAIGEVAAKNTAGISFYNFSGNSYISGQRYFRLKMNNADGRNQYSQIVTLKNENSLPVAVISNPVRDNKVRLQLGQIPAGNYNIRLFASNGQLLHSETFSNKGNQTVHEVSPAGILAPGTYIISFTGNNISQQAKIIVE